MNLQAILIDKMHSQKFKTNLQSIFRDKIYFIALTLSAHILLAYLKWAEQGEKYFVFKYSNTTFNKFFDLPTRWLLLIKKRYYFTKIRFS